MIPVLRHLTFEVLDYHEFVRQTMFRKLGAKWTLTEAFASDTNFIGKLEGLDLAALHVDLCSIGWKPILIEEGAHSQIYGAGKGLNLDRLYTSVRTEIIVVNYG